MLGANTRIHRSADRSLLYLLQPNISSGTRFTYDSVSDTFGPQNETNLFLDKLGAAVSRDGSMLATQTGAGILLERSSDYSDLHGFSPWGPAVFGGAQDILYAFHPPTDEIFAYNTTDYSELFHFPLGEDVVELGENLELRTWSRAPTGDT